MNAADGLAALSGMVGLQGLVTVAFGGSISAEQGIGQYRVTELPRCRAAPKWQLARRVQRALNSDGLFSPGKVCPRARA